MPLFRGNDNYAHEVHSHNCGYLPHRDNRSYFVHARAQQPKQRFILPGQSSSLPK